MSAKPRPFRWTSHYTNLVMAAFAVLLFGFVLWDRGNVTTDEASGRDVQIFDSWRTIERVEIIQDGVTTAVESDGDEGYAVASGGDTRPADEQSVASWLLSLEYALFERKVDGLDDVTMGIDKPRMDIRLKMEHLTYRMVVGGPAPQPSSSSYIVVEGGPRGRQGYVVKDALLKEILIDPSALRSKVLVPVLSSNIESWSFKSESHAWVLRRGTWGGRVAGAFLIEGQAVSGSPTELLSKGRARRDALQSWLAILGGLEVDTVRAVPKATAPLATLSFNPRSGKTAKGELAFYGPCEANGVAAPGYLVARTEPLPLAGCVPTSEVENLLIGAERFVDRSVIGSTYDEFITISWRTASATTPRLAIARKDSGWIVQQPPGASVEDAAVTDLLKRLLTLDGVPTTESSLKEPLGTPSQTIEIRAVPEGSQKSERVERIDVFGNHPDGSILVRRQDDAQLLALPMSAAPTLTPAVRLLRSRQILDERDVQIRQLDVACDGQSQSVVRSLGGQFSWDGEPPAAGLRPDPALFSELVTLMSQLKAVRWVSEKARDEHGLSNTTCKVVVGRVDAGDAPNPDATVVTRSLRLGARTQGGRFAQVGANGPVFVAEPRLVRLARSWLIDRAALVVDPNRVTKLTISYVGGAKITFERQGNGLVLSGTKQPAARIEEALKALLAEGVAQVGKPGEADGPPQLTLRYKRDDGAERTLTIGRSDVISQTSVYRVWRDDLNATYTVAQARLRPFFEAQ